MTITIGVFESSPDRGAGLARDMGVRWALEEAGLAYEVRPLSSADLKAPAHRARQPFGQIPTYEDGDLTLFESGAIILHIAQSRDGLLPSDPAARARAIGWMFAAFSTIEPPLVAFGMSALFDRERSWFAERQPALEAALRTRLADLSARLGGTDWLDGAFSAGDLAMIAVLRRLHRSGMLQDYPNLAGLVARGEGRPAFQRAFAAQRALFEASRG